MVDAAAEICSTSNVILIEFHQLYFYQNMSLEVLISLENISTLKSIITLFETHELALRS
jgi:hypothetical protein